ncbi:ABC1 kinase family protein [Methylocaldum szegediense]|uniref:Ubiquinone biosynthesis protein n=1 Tax=Methylocaldum szegediense TaxID=73780 RepID=A0ABM9I3Y1_9GAMM|nr:AarF/UbiB family protein [Methylocaldum szegediense]CAI8875523.1 ubiquinone biosynthesis protein [Methylocaldum szegediense]
MILETLSAMRDLGRLHDIASILIRYGFGDLVRRLGLERLLEKAGRALNWTRLEELLHLDPPQRVRRALEEMGPTFIKFGQILATRVDLFPPDWIAEFEKLHDRVPPLPFERLRSQIEEDLNGPVDEVFVEFDETPLAAASIAQVHRARLPDGQQVIVKIRRPGIRPTIEADLRLLERLVAIVEREFPDVRRFHPQEVLRQFKISLRNELDLLTEARNTARAADNFADEPAIVIPKVYWEYCGERINVQEYIEGIPGRDFNALDAAGLDRKVLAQRGADAVLKMVLIDGFFHADPHPGNFIYLSENRLAFIDFGMVGLLSESRRDQVVDMLNAIVVRDAATVVDVLLDWAGDAAPSTERLTAEVGMFIDKYHGVALKQLRLGDMLTEMTSLMRDHQLTLPPDLTMLFKALITLEGTGRQLDPDFDIVAQASPLLQQASVLRFHPDTLLRKGQRNLISLMAVLSALPQDIRRLMRLLRSGAFNIHVDLSQLDRFGMLMDRAASRLTVGMVTASLIIGSSIVMTVEGGPTLFGLPAFGVLGFTAAGIGGLWVLISIWKTSRKGEP